MVRGFPCATLVRRFSQFKSNSDYPGWDTLFCHDYEFSFSLLDFLFREYELDAVLDHALFMENVAQTWHASWLYKPDGDTAQRR